MAQNIAKCGNCGVVNFCDWYGKDAPKDSYGRIDRDYMDSNPVAYCSEECRDTAEQSDDTRLHVEPGQVYRSCAPRDQRQIRVVEVSPNGVKTVDANTGNWPVQYPITRFHDSLLTRDGRSRRFGFALVEQCP